MTRVHGRAFTSIVATMPFGAFARGTRFRLYSFATIAVVVVVGALAGFLARPRPIISALSARPTPRR